MCREDADMEQALQGKLRQYPYQVAVPAPLGWQYGLM